MVNKQFTLEVRTPLMIGSQTEQIGTQRERSRQGNRNVTFKVLLRRAELKANSFKGVIRWWFRCLHGFNENLFERSDNPLFGSTRSSSPFKLIVIPKNIKTRIFESRLEGDRIGTYRFSGGTGNYDGLSYFGYNLFNKSWKPGKEKISKTEYFEPGMQFDIKVIANGEDTLNKVLLIFWLALQFGGFGARSRRCFGNIKIASSLDLFNKEFSFKNTFENESDYDKTIKSNFEIVKKIFGVDFNFVQEKSKIPTLSSSRLFLSRAIEDQEGTKKEGSNSQLAEALMKAELTSASSRAQIDWKKAINFAGCTMQLFRALRNNDHTNVHKFGTLAKIERAVFGLPLEFRFSQRGLNPVNVNHYDEKNEAQRMGSPVFVSATEINNQLHIQYLIMSFDYSTLNLKANSTKNISVNNILPDFCDFLLNPNLSHISPTAKLNRDINIKDFKHNEKTKLLLY